MRRNAILFGFVILLLFLYFNLNATTSQRIIAWIQPVALSQPSFFVDANEPETQTQTQPQSQTQTQTQTQTQSQTQTQTQTQPLFIGFPLEVSWKFRTNGPVIAQPQVDQTTVYCVSKAGVVYRVSQTDHKHVWRRNLGDVVEESFLLKDGVLYVGTQRGSVRALDAEKGVELWTQTVDGESFLTQPVVDAHKVYFVGLHGTIISLRLKRGAFAWKFKVSADCNTTPFVSQTSLYFGCDDKYLYALDTAAGFVKWKFPAGTAVRGSPIAADGNIFFGAEDSYFYGLSERDGSINWKYKTGAAVRGIPMFYKDEEDGKIKEVLTPSLDNLLYSLKIKNGGVKWLSILPTRLYTRMHFDRALIFLASFGPTVLGYDPHTGQRVGNFATGSRIRSAPNTANDRLFLGLNNGTLICLTRKPPPPPQTEEAEQTQTQTQTQTSETAPESEELEPEPETQETEPETQTQSQTQVPSRR